MPYINRDNNPTADKLMYVLGPPGQPGERGPTGPQGPQGPAGGQLVFTDLIESDYTALFGEFVVVGGGESSRTITLPLANVEGEVGIVVVQDVICSFVPQSGDTINNDIVDPVTISLNQSIILKSRGNNTWIVTSWVPSFP